MPAFLIIMAKLSDIFGRKSSVTISFIAFVVFSGGCGAAQTMTQLLVPPADVRSHAHFLGLYCELFKASEQQGVTR